MHASCTNAMENVTQKETVPECAIQYSISKTYKIGKQFRQLQYMISPVTLTIFLLMEWYKSKRDENPEAEMNHMNNRKPPGRKEKQHEPRVLQHLCTLKLQNQSWEGYIKIMSMELETGDTTIHHLYVVSRLKYSCNTTLTVGYKSNCSNFGQKVMTQSSETGIHPCLWTSKTKWAWMVMLNRFTRCAKGYVTYLNGCFCCTFCFLIFNPYPLFGKVNGFTGDRENGIVLVSKGVRTKQMTVKTADLRFGHEEATWAYKTRNNLQRQDQNSWNI